MKLATSIVRPAGAVGYVGVPYGVSTFDARKLFGSNISIAGALAPTRAYIDELMDDVAAGVLGAAIMAVLNARGVFG